MHTLPTTPKSTAKVQPGHGVKINYIYYWSDAFRHPEVEGSRIEVRFDPWDAGIAYVFVRHRWVECRSERYTVFHNRSERELMIATQELRKRYKRHASQLNVTAMKLAKFLESSEAEEALLRQRAADRESRVVLAAVNGELLPRTVELANCTTVEPSSDSQSDSQEATTTQPLTSLGLYGYVSPKSYEEF